MAERCDICGRYRMSRTAGDPPDREHRMCDVEQARQDAGLDELYGVVQGGA